MKTLLRLGLIVGFFGLVFLGALIYGLQARAQTELPEEVWVFTAYVGPDYTSEAIDMRMAAYAGLKVLGLEANSWLRVKAYGGRELFVPPGYVSACPVGAEVMPLTGKDSVGGYPLYESDKPVKVKACTNLYTLIVEVKGVEKAMDLQGYPYNLR